MAATIAESMERIFGAWAIAAWAAMLAGSFAIIVAGLWYLVAKIRGRLPADKPRGNVYRPAGENPYESPAD